MLFNSHIFIFIFLPLFLAGWYLLNNLKHYKLAQGYLVGMSLWFYAYFGAENLIFLIGTGIFGYLCSFLLEKYESQNIRKLITIFGCVIHIALLGYFKYAGFFADNINAVFGTGIQFENFFIPLAISFITFKQISFLIDRYKKEADHCLILDYFSFLTYFPQLLQGPIMYHHELIDQFHDVSKRKFDQEDFAKGIAGFVIGLSKKVLIADSLAMAVNYGYSNIAGLDTVTAILTGLGYSLELYFDFSGYCDMATGIGRMTGIYVVKNFDSPYKSVSVKEFWRRWHITLGRFFTRYVYIPLGGSRKGKVRMVLNTIIVFLLSGLWHGANWTFILWGLLHGIGVSFGSLENLRIPKIAKQAITFVYVCLAFVFFRADNIGDGLNILKAMVTPLWNSNFFSMAAAAEFSEVYVITKLLTMKAASLLPWFNGCTLLLLFGVSVFAVTRKNTEEIVNTKKLTVTYSFLLAILFVWSIISMTGVSTFLYFSF